MNPVRRVAARAVIAIVILAVTAACTTTQGSDKTGGDTVVLTLATFEGQPNANGQNHGPEAFVEHLGKVSQGRLKVELKTEYGDGAADAESKIVRAIAAGEVDGGWPSTRAFARGGVPGLEVVEAPLTITSYAAQKALVSGPVAGKLLARLDGSGMAGLGLAVGPLRRPFAANQPLLAPEDWKGHHLPGLQLPRPGRRRPRPGRDPGRRELLVHRPDQRGNPAGRRVRHRPVRGRAAAGPKPATSPPTSCSGRRCSCSP